MPMDVFVQLMEKYFKQVLDDIMEKLNLDIGDRFYEACISLCIVIISFFVLSSEMLGNKIISLLLLGIGVFSLLLSTRRYEGKK